MNTQFAFASFVLRWATRNILRFFQIQNKVEIKMYTSMVYFSYLLHVHTYTRARTSHSHSTVNTWAHSLCIFQNFISFLRRQIMHFRMIATQSEWQMGRTEHLCNFKNEFRTVLRYLFDWFCNWFWWRFLYDIIRCCLTNCVRRKHYSVRNDISLLFNYNKRTSTLPNALHIEHARTVFNSIGTMKWF